MAFFGKTYTLVKNEGYLEWLLSTGATEEKAKAGNSAKTSQSIVQNGDGTYTMTITNSGGPRSSTFKSGVEMDDVIGENNIPIKSTYTVDGNVVTQTIMGPRGAATFKREYNGDDLVVTITGESFDGVAKRYYKA